jgi:hypothetical protein
MPRKTQVLAVVADFVNETREGRLEKQLGALLRSELNDLQGFGSDNRSKNAKCNQENW